MVVSLFTREWIEIQKIYLHFGSVASLPLYEGVDWNSAPSAMLDVKFTVSLFTREWIEIQVFLLSCGGGGSNANNLSDIGIYPA